MYIGSRTPWGKADFVRPHAEGITFVGMPGHGGYKLDRKRNAQVHPAWRQKGGWYEEDCAAWIVVYTFAEQVGKNRADATQSLKNYYPDAYMTITGEKVTAAESYVVREREFNAVHVSDYVTRTAWGDWHPSVPKGKVGVRATLGGILETEERYYLVDESRYGNRIHSGGGYVINPSLDASWSGPK